MKNKNLPQKKEEENGNEITAEVSRLLKQIFGSASNEIGQILGNELKAFKAQRIIKLSEKLQTECKNRNINKTVARRIPFGIGIRIIEEASKEDDEDVLSMWAKIIASSLDPKGSDPNKIFISIIKELSCIEINILQFLWMKKGQLKLFHSPQNTHAIEEVIEQNLTIHPIENRLIALENLIKQRCVHQEYKSHMMHDIELNSNEFIMGGKDGENTLEEISKAFSATKEIIEDLSSKSGPLDSMPEIKYREDHLFSTEQLPFIPENSYDLTNLGIRAVQC